MEDSAGITVFVCANCARPGMQPAAGVKARPVVPDFNWPGRVQQIVIPCTGRLQPEHVLKAFESGSSVVSVVACREDNCHYIEGSRRCALRVDYIRSILKEIGLGEGRLLLSYLPGSASQDLARAAGKITTENHSDSLETQIAAIRDKVIEILRTYPPNPLQQLSKSAPAGDSLQEEMSLSKGYEDE
jgi:F420-non-reducing hydrogenase iron-sulfur subunit